MTDTLSSLRAEAQRTKPTKSGADTLILRAWKAALDSVRGSDPPDLVGCGDHSCCVASPKGMGTNGGCRCSERDLRRAVLILKTQRKVYMANLEPK